VRKDLISPSGSFSRGEANRRWFLLIAGFFWEVLPHAASPVEKLSEGLMRSLPKILCIPLTILNNTVLNFVGHIGAMRFWVFAFVLLASPALAEDYVPPEFYEAPEVSSGWDYDWAGSYLGVSAALAAGAHETVGVGGISASSDDLTGTGLGLYLGQNYHVTRFVFGTEMDFAKTDITGEFDLPGSSVACGAVGFSCDTSISWVGSFRGRAGVAFNSFLPYVTAGVAVAGVDTHYAGPLLDKSVTGLGAGFVLGGGLDYAVMKNLIVRGEVLHYELSDVGDTVLGTKVSSDPQFTVVRAGVSLKF
jgi:outer membrane immunogenic protein